MRICYGVNRAPLRLGASHRYEPGDVASACAALLEGGNTLYLEYFPGSYATLQVPSVLEMACHMVAGYHDLTTAHDAHDDGPAGDYDWLDEDLDSCPPDWSDSEDPDGGCDDAGAPVVDVPPRLVSRYRFCRSDEHNKPFSSMPLWYPGRGLQATPGSPICAPGPGSVPLV